MQTNKYRTIYSVEKHYIEENMIVRCANIQKYAAYLTEKIKEQKIDTVYIGSLTAEMDELIKKYYELKSVNEKILLLEKLEEGKND